MELFHVTNNIDSVLNNGFCLSKSGTAKNGDQQAAGIHLSSRKDFVMDRYYGYGCSLISCELPKNSNIQDYEGEADISIYTNVLIDFIGEDLITQLSEDIEYQLKDDAPLSFNIDVDEELYRSLIIKNDAFIENLKEYFNIDKDLQKRIDTFLSHSFELDIGETTNDNCYRMLSAILGSRQKASEKLSGYNIDGFRYTSIHNNEKIENICMINPFIIKNINVLENYPKSKKRKNFN